MQGPETGSPGFPVARLGPARQAGRKGPWPHPVAPGMLGYPGGRPRPLWVSAGDEGAEGWVHRVAEADDSR